MQVTLADKSYQHIRRKLASGELGPGDRLVTRSLAEEIGVSLGPVREAINRLATEGLLHHVPGAGASVREIDRNELDELYVLRDALESCAAGEAARMIAPAQLSELQAILDDMRQLADDVRRQPQQHATAEIFHHWLDDEEQFHETLVEASRNRLLAKVLGEYRAIHRIFGAQRRTPEVLTVEVADRTCRDRAEFLAALENHDVDQSRQLMSDHIQKGRATVMSHLRRTRGNARS